MPANEPYQLLHTASLVGLFSCIFVKASQRDYIDHVHAAELKRGLGGLHGNKVNYTLGSGVMRQLIRLLGSFDLALHLSRQFCVPDELPPSGGAIPDCTSQ